MSGQETEKDDKCRICLEDNVERDWNDLLYDSHLTYKDCYYKYTQLEYIDGDDFSSWLCRNCSNGLEYIDAFISKAIETDLMLQKRLSLNMTIEDVEDDIKNEASNFETILVEETEIKLEIPEAEEDLSIVPADEICMIPEKCASSLTGTRIPRRRKTRKTPKKKKLENSNDELTNGKSSLDDKKLSTRVEDPICCSICSKVLASRYKAIQHEKIHSEHRERNMTCETCGLKFYNKLNLTSHMLTHLDNREKPHKCEFCVKAFYYKGALNVHRRIHLGLMVSCSLCTKQFYRQIDLDKHMTSHAAARITSDIKTRKKYFVPCKDCGENVRSTSFKSHMAKHMNEPLFKCSICNKEFFFRDSCLKHIKVHHKKTTAERLNFIIAYKKNRISHLFLEQYTSVRANDE